MPEDLQPTASVPAQSAPESTPAAAPVVAEPVSPQQAARAEVYSRYYGATPATTPQVATETPVAPEPTPVPDEPVAAPSAPSLPPEIVELLQGLTTQVAELKQQQVPQAPVAPAAPGAPDPTWIDLIAAGKFDEARKALQDEIASTVGARIQSEAETRAEARMAERMRVERDIDSFLTNLKGENPDIVGEPTIEEMIYYKANARLNQAQAEGKIKSSDDFLNVYKKVVSEETANARKFIQHIRAAGKTEAMTTKQTVLSASTLPPSAIEQNRSAAPSQPEAETAELYLKRRMDESLRRKGMLA